METQKMEPNPKQATEITPPVRSRKKKLPFGRIALLLVLVAVVVGAIYFGTRTTEESLPMGSTYTVARNDLLVSVVEGGNLKAQRSVEVQSKVEGRATIVYLIPEGSYVKEGDILVELDSAELEETAVREEIEYEEDYASWISAKENFAIQLNQNQSDITAGELNVEFAQKELDKYNQGGWPLELSILENDITIAEEELKRAEDTVKWTKELHDKGFVTRDELEADLLAQKKRLIALEQAREEKVLTEKYDHPMQLRKLESDHEEAKMELERIKRRAESQKAQKDAELKNRSRQLSIQEERRDKAKEQLVNSTIKAPQGGLVVYGSQDDGGRHRFGGSDSNNVEEGAEVRYRQTLITLPDVSVMVVDTDVHESAVDKVSVGMDALVSIEAFPDMELDGKVTKVALLPDSQSRWLNPDLKVYTTEITLDETNGKLKPGMSAKVEIIVKRLKDVISVPVQSVYRRGGREVCYIANGGDIEVRPVSVGMDNEKFVEIKSGLEEGEMVLLYPPTLGGDVEGEEEDVEETKEGETLDAEGPATKPDLTERQGGERRSRMGGGGEFGETGGEGRQGGPGGRRGGQMSAEMMKEMQKFRDMTPEERKAAMEKLRAEGKIPAEGFGRGGGRDGGGEGGREGRGERSGRNRDGGGERSDRGGKKKPPGDNEK